MSNAEIIFSLQESPEGGYEARALGFAIFTQAHSLEELRAWFAMPFPATSKT